MKVELTKSQVRNLAEFIEYNILDVVRNDTDIENVDWLVEMCEAYKILKQAIEETNEEEMEPWKADMMKTFLGERE